MALQPRLVRCARHGDGRSPLRDWGDGLCVASLALAALAVALWLAWYVWQMPPVH